MSEEEKKAIKKLERGALEYIDSNEIEAVLNLIEKYKVELIETKEANRQLNIEIEKQNNRLEQLEKENKELKATLKCTQDSWFEDTKKIEELNAYIKKLDELNTKDFIFKHELENYIPKSVIREKIEELEKQNSNEPQGTVRDYIDKTVIQILKELLGEEK